MALYYRTKGIILKKEDRSEADRVFTIFTDAFGKLEVVGRAIRKINSKLRAGIDVCRLSEIEFIQGKFYKTLTDSSAIERFKNISQNPEKLDVYHKIAELIDCYINGQEKDENIFNLLNETLARLNSQNSHSLIYHHFFWNFFSILGYQPEIYKCSACREKLNPYSIYFSNKERGVICNNCLASDREAEKINPDVVKVLRLFLKNDWQIISKLKIDKLSQILLEKVSANYHLYNKINNSQYV
jgi:DNA repair protein RecO (recombination protein O)